VRRHVVPGNPQTAEQSLTRDVFRFLTALYKLTGGEITTIWDAYAKGLVLTGRNAFLSKNMSALRTAVNLNDLIVSPGALGGLPPSSLTVTGGVGTLTVACTFVGSTPAGWTLIGALLGLVSDQDPHDPIGQFGMAALEDDIAPYSQVISAGAGDYQGFAILKWTRPDGLTAYSPSLIAPGTVT